jgi:hypothetical protein
LTLLGVGREGAHDGLTVVVAPWRASLQEASNTIISDDVITNR